MSKNTLKKLVRTFSFLLVFAFATSFICLNAMAADKPSGIGDGSNNTIGNGAVIIGDVYLPYYDTAAIFKLIVRAVEEGKDPNVYYIRTDESGRGVYNLSEAFDISGDAGNVEIDGSGDIDDFINWLNDFVEQRAEYTYDVDTEEIKDFEGQVLVRVTGVSVSNTPGTSTVTVTATAVNYGSNTATVELVGAGAPAAATGVAIGSGGAISYTFADVSNGTYTAKVTVGSTSVTSSDSITVNVVITVAAPSITTDPADVSAIVNNGTVEVTMATTTSGATIYYTLDGTTPSAQSTAYSAPFEVTTSNTAGETVIVKAIAILGTDSSTVSSVDVVFAPVA